MVKVTFSIFVRRGDIDRFGQREIRHLRRHGDAGLVIFRAHLVVRSGVDIPFIRRSHFRGIGLHSRRGDRGHNLQLGRGGAIQIADGPDSGATVVRGGSTRSGGDKRQAGGEEVGDNHARRVARPGVGRRDGEHDRFSDVRGGVVDNLCQRQINLQGSQRDARLVVFIGVLVVRRGVWIELIHVGDFAGVGMSSLRGHGGGDGQRGDRAAVERSESTRRRFRCYRSWFRWERSKPTPAPPGGHR